MASAVLPSRNEQCWGERKAYMGNYSNNPTNITRITTRFNSNPSPMANPHPNPAQSLTQNPNSNLIQRTHDPKNHLRQKNEPPNRRPVPPSSPPAVFSDSQLSHRKPEGAVLLKDPFYREYLTFNLTSYSKEELKELKERLKSELQCVRRLLTRIEAVRPDVSRPGLFSPQSMLPPSVEVNHHVSEPSVEKRTPKGNQPSGSSGFVTRNDEIKKKISGQKRTLLSTAGPGSKRSAVPKSEFKKVEDAMMVKCKQILTKLLRLKHAFVFGKPVDVQGLKLHDYYQIIKQPMDLGTVKSRLSKKEYQTPLDFASDVRLTFENALKYNPKGHEVHAIADAMLSKFETLFRPEYEKYETEYRNARTKKLAVQNSRVAKAMAMVEKYDVMMPPLTTVMSPRPSGSRKLPKPKAKDPNKRSMTVEEKRKLASRMENIPKEKMEQMVQIVRKRNPRLSPEAGEIEIDVDALDVETLWELDRFVNNHKSTGGKIRRQDLTGNASITEVENASLGEVLKGYVPSQLLEVSGQKNKKWDAGEEDIDIGEELPADDYPPVQIDKDPAGASDTSSSSGSSSSSGHDSSSDSDSGSSSGSDSDEDSVHSPGVDHKGATAT